MKGVWGVGPVMAAMLLAAPGAAQEDCARIDLRNCPSYFAEQCRDESFRARNVDACFDALTDPSDAAYCTAEAVAACAPKEGCDDLDDPVKRHFCAAGQSTCSTSIPGLLGDYEGVLGTLRQSLADYDQLTTLDLGQATSIDVLCEYRIDRLRDLRRQAETEIGGLESSEARIDRIDQCAATMQSFLDAGAPPDLPAELWDQIVNVLIEGMTDIRRARGQIQSGIESLRDAPDKLRSLQLAYGLVCAPGPDS